MILGTFAFLAFVVWITVEFLGAILWLSKILERLGRHPGEEHESVHATVRHMDDWPYAATRNAQQHMRGGKHG